MYYEKISPLSNHFGVEVIGAKLHPNMGKEAIYFIESLILEHKLVVFRNQELTAEEQIVTCKQFGDIEPHPLKQNTCPYPEMTIVSNMTEDGEVSGYPGPAFPIWHSDMCYEPNPPKFSFLYGEKVPDVGGQTLFANSTLAYDELEDKIKHALADAKAVFGFSKKLMQRCHDKGYELQIAEEDKRPDSEHSVFRTHPITGKKSIFINWTHTDSIVGMKQAESQKWLDKLFSHSTKEKYVYAHEYQKNDLVVWDNCATLHTGDGSITPDKPRYMRRVVVRY